MTDRSAPRSLSDHLLQDYGLSVSPTDRAALARCLDEIIVARHALRPLLPGDEPAPVFRPGDLPE